MKLEFAEINWAEPPAKRMHAIAGNESAKRALEVVLAGGHKVVILSTVRSPASELLRAAANIAKANGIPFSGMVIPVCPCGAHGNPKEECNCSSTDLRKYARKIMPLMKAADIVIETVEPLARDTTRANEHEDRIVARVLAARMAASPDASLPTDTQELLHMATAEMGADRDKATAVASTIAKMDGSAIVQPNHMAEAIQYQHRHAARWFDQMEEATA